MSNRWRAFWRRITPRHLVLWAGLLVVVLGTWGLIALTDEVVEGETQHFDKWMTHWFSVHAGPPWLQEAGRDFTALGGNAVLPLIVLVVVGYLLIDRKRGAAGLIVAAVVGGVIIVLIVKYFIARPRPPASLREAYVFTKSFPSGHSMLAAVTYLTLGALLAQVTRGKWLRLYIIAVAVLVTLLVGVSRVYLRVHWPTDVLAGWTAGLIWAILCQLVAHWLQRRGAVEPGGDESDQ